jgi:hypothetical protein
VKDSINPVAAGIAIVVVLLVAGGIWFFTSNPAAGRPGAGGAGRTDPFLSGPNSVMQNARPGSQREPGGPAGPGGR